MKALLPLFLHYSHGFLRIGRWVLLAAVALLPLHGQGQVRSLAPPMLLTFTAVPTGWESQLKWTTAQESGSLAGFSVERSQDGRFFQSLVAVSTCGGTERSSYAWKDTTVAAATVACMYYRLRVLFANGTETFSPVRAVRWPKGPAPFQVFPTVLGDGPLRYQYDGILAANAVVEIANSKGKLVWWQAASQGPATYISLPHLPSGWYAVRLTNNNQSFASCFCQQ